MNTVEVLHRLEPLHPIEFGEWSFHREVFGIDAYAVRLFQGRDQPFYRRVAYEVKVSRSDFLNEIRKPEKRRTALALSHQYYLALPADLAASCLAEVEALIPEAGVLAVNEEPVRDGGGRRLPFIGCGPMFSVRMLRKAPIRPCRGWTAREWSNLLRRAHRPDQEAESLRRRLELAEEREKAANRALRAAEQKRSMALQQLDEFVAPSIEAGTTWRHEDGRLARIEPPTSFTLRLLDAPESDWRSHVYVRAADLLTEWKAEDGALATSDGRG